MSIKTRVARLESQRGRADWRPFDWDAFRARMTARLTAVLAGTAPPPTGARTERQQAMLDRLEKLNHDQKA